MIFVTVGTTMPFDDMIREMDRLVKSKAITDQVICQIGNGEYIPEHCEYFRFNPSLDDWIEKADVVVCHGGTGSVLGAIANGKQFVAVANPKGADDHQTQFLNQVAQNIPILWTKNLASIAALIQQAKNTQHENLTLPSLYEDLKDYLDLII